jgi:hypothetical protein
VKRWILLALAALLSASCEFKEVKREVGYKGKARVDPWLAAERFSQRMGHSTESLLHWRAPETTDAVWFVPAVVFNNRSYVRQAEAWTEQGGHLILLIEHASAASHDWSKSFLTPDLEAPFREFLHRANLELEEGASKQAARFEFDGGNYKVNAESKFSVRGQTTNSGLLASAPFGDGRITVVTDARIFRNRWIDESDHASLLDAIIDQSDYDGTVVFMRGMELSLWKMVKEHLWALLIGLAVLVLFWLWKNLARFGPVEASQAPSELRGYDRHLEALGDFQWRVDHASSLLAPLRAQIVELGQRASLRAGCRDQDFFQFLGDRAGIPRDRVFRAMAEVEPSDAPILTRTTADLQKLLQVLRHPSQS